MTFAASGRRRPRPRSRVAPGAVADRLFAARRASSVRWCSSLSAACWSCSVHVALAGAEDVRPRVPGQQGNGTRSPDFGALAPLYGTLVTSAIALLIGVPVSFGIALFLTELCPVWLKRPIGIAIELLAAIPSIIYGMWGLFVFAPFFAGHVQPWLTDHLGPGRLGPLFHGAALGIGMLTAGLILAIMIIPFMAAVMRDVFETVPTTLRESAYALGAHDLGGGLARGLAIHARRRHRRRHARPRPRPRRDHGGDVRHRQRP